MIVDQEDMKIFIQAFFYNKRITLPSEKYLFVSGYDTKRIFVFDLVVVPIFLMQHPGIGILFQGF
jgi:hypothetical protein